MSKKSGRAALDLTDLVEPIDLKIGDYEAELTGDMALTSMAKMARAFSRIGEVISGDLELTDLGVSEDEMWALVEEVLSNATPPPDEPRAGLTTQAAIRLLTFLAARTSDAVETTSSKK